MIKRLIYPVLFLALLACQTEKMVFIQNTTKQPVVLKIPESEQVYYFGRSFPEIKLAATGKERKIAIKSGETNRWSKSDKRNFYELLQKSQWIINNDTTLSKRKIKVYKVQRNWEILVFIK